ncbi:MAG TPA: hypothetical protein VFW71_13340 [Actinomycetota bacterium]|nr:hypothetical protein [Actinomycetota bacterium]
MPVRAALKGVLPGELVDLGKRLERALVPSARQAERTRRFRRALEADVRGLTGNMVLDGPFRGLRYLPATTWGTAAPILVGTYEQELVPVVESWVLRAPDLFVDVGCAEGYYAVGMAVRLPGLRVVAFDADPRAQGECRDMARRNGVGERVEVRGGCRGPELVALLGSGTRGVLLVDCEGCERELLTAEVVAALAGTEVLVELHEFASPGLSEAVVERFRPSHQVELIRAWPRTAVPPALEHLPPEAVAAALDELRPTTPHPMEWAHCVPMAPGAAGEEG